MAIESVIELKVVGLDELEERLAALRNVELSVGAKGGFEQLKQFNNAPQNLPNANNNNIAYSLRDASNNVNAFSRSVVGATHAIGSATMTLARMVKNIAGVGTALAGVSSILSLSGLIAGAGAVNQRTFQSAGFGLANPNVLRGLQSTYGMFGETSGLMGTLNIGAANPGSVTLPALASIMRQTGSPITVEALRNMNPEERARRTYQAMFAASRDPKLRKMLSMPELVSSLGLEGIAGPEQMNRMMQYSPQQFSEMQGVYNERRPFLEMSPQTRFAYQKFGAQRETGMQAVETQLLNAMRPVLEPINKLFTAIFTKLNSGSGKFQDFVRGMAEDINLFADAISEGKWKELFDHLKEQAKAMWEDIKPYAHDAWEWIKTKADESWDGLVAYFKEKYPDLTEKLVKFANALSVITDKIMSLISKMEGVPNPMDLPVGEIADYAMDDFHKWKEEHGIPNVSIKGMQHGALEAYHKTINFFKGKGWTEDQAEGLAANFMGESSMNPQAVGDSGSSFGLGQWRGERKKEFERIFGKPLEKSTLEEQLQFAHYELTEGREKKAGMMLKGAGDIESAVSAVTRGYERPADPNAATASRIAIARSMKSAFRNANVPSNGYEPGGAQWMQAPMSRAYPTLTIKNVNNPQSDNNMQLGLTYGQALSGTGN